MAFLPFSILKKIPGKNKMIQMILAGAMQRHLLKYGLNLTGAIFFPYYALLTTSFACLFKPIILPIASKFLPKFIKIFTTKSKTPWGLIFNSLACIAYMTSGGLLVFSSGQSLNPIALVQSFIPAFQGLPTTDIMSSVANILNGLDVSSLFNLFQNPTQLVQMFFQAFPAHSSMNVMTFMASISHGVDAYSSYKQYKGR